MNNTNIKIAKQLIKIAKELISSKYYDVSSYKNDIKDFIQKCRKNEKPVSHRKDYTFTSIFYRALRKKINNNSEQNNELNNEEISRYYTSNINKILPIENQGTWKQYSTSKKNQIKDGKTYNLYYTIQFDDRTDIENYINFIKDVIPEIEKYTKETGKGISFKTFKELDRLFTENDTIKFYYYDSSVKHDLQRIIQNQMSKNGVKEGKRIYKKGIDKEPPKDFMQFIKDESISQEDKSFGSFGEIMSVMVANYIDEFIHSSRVSKDASSQELTELVIKKFDDFVRASYNRYKNVSSDRISLS